MPGDEHLGLVIHISKKYSNSILPLAELIQEGTIGLMIAMKKFNPERRIKFSTYATYWIEAAIRRAIKKEVKRTELLTEVDLEWAQQKKEFPQDVKMVLQDLGNKMQTQDKKVIFMRYGISPYSKSHTFKEVGEELGLSKQRVQQIEEKAILRMRELVKGIII